MHLTRFLIRLCLIHWWNLNLPNAESLKYFRIKKILLHLSIKLNRITKISIQIYWLLTHVTFCDYAVRLALKTWKGPMSMFRLLGRWGFIEKVYNSIIYSYFKHTHLLPSNPTLRQCVNRSGHEFSPRYLIFYATTCIWYENDVSSTP